MGEWILPEEKAEIEQLKKATQEREREKEVEHDIEIHNLANYLILDAVVWEYYMDDIFQSDTEFCSLFATRGADTDLDTVAPYLLKYSNNTEFADWLNDKQRKKMRRLYIKSDLSIEKLRKHFRHFLRIKTEEGKWLYFRFYDPYVVNTVFPNLTKEQVNEFFDKIEYLVTEDIRINERRIYYLSFEKELRIKQQTIRHVDNK